MNKITCLGLVFILVLGICPVAFATYEGEILFRDIPWDTNMPSFMEKLLTDIPLTIMSDTLGGAYVQYFDVFNSGMFSTYNFLGYGNYCHGFNMEVQGNVLVGGWPLQSVEGYSINKVENGSILHDLTETRMINCDYIFDMAKISDYELAHQNLKDKLVTIYGNTDISINTYRECDVWFGKNNTYVCLVVEHNEPMKLKYGITNALSLFNEIDFVACPYDLENKEGL